MRSIYFNSLFFIPLFIDPLSTLNLLRSLDHLNLRLNIVFFIKPPFSFLNIPSL